MALETVVYPQDQFPYGCKDFYTWGHDYASGFLDHNLEAGLLHGNWDSSSSSVIQDVKEWDPISSSPEGCTGDHLLGEDQCSMMEAQPETVASGRRKRRRNKSCKNKEELENQRMTHIAVERNRRKQMNEYLAIIRSLMPASYVQRGDQASIIGGAINFVKELEQHLQTLESQKRTSNQQPKNGNLSPLFADFFSFPQYSTSSAQSSTNSSGMANETMAENRSALADIEVTMAESHANLKILSKKRPRQLLKIVAGLQCLWLTILHVNVTTVDQMVLYTFSVKLEDGCQLTTVEEIASAINHLLGRIQEEAALS
ncbi:hypothetical protein RJ639_039664 [Escallonia herrerae]|uniref:BHLH domain-containing protein n=1 Tax=Escallonia herrerae TaxID=1293975 RepID=A0AA88WMX1_9ASTE|nr:hypothetical protein RJ639_039664 [Escallonia herrerae]